MHVAVDVRAKIANGFDVTGAGHDDSRHASETTFKELLAKNEGDDTQWLLDDTLFPAAAGTYFARLVVGGEQLTRKVLLVK